jgi:hypothetical protein
LYLIFNSHRACSIAEYGNNSWKGNPRLWLNLSAPDCHTICHSSSYAIGLLVSSISISWTSKLFLPTKILAHPPTYLFHPFQPHSDRPLRGYANLSGERLRDRQEGWKKAIAPLRNCIKDNLLSHPSIVQ